MPIARTSKAMKNSPVWEAGGVRLLREITYLFMHRRGKGHAPLSISELGKLLDEQASGAASRKGKVRGRAREARLRYFLFGLTEKPHSSELFSRIFHLVVPWFKLATQRGELRQCRYKTQVESRNWYAYLDEAPTPVEVSYDSEGAGYNSAAQIADMLALGFDITDREFAEAAEVLTGRRDFVEGDATETDARGFVTFRYSTTAGNIIRSFLQVSPLTRRFPFCRYQHFYRYKDRDLERDTCGVAVRLGRAIYLIGMLPPREGFEVMVLPMHSGSASLLSGLVLTANNVGEALVSRVAMEKSSSVFANVEAASAPALLRYPIRKKDMPSREVLLRIRNHIDFEVGDEIQYQGKQGVEMISARRMTELVKVACDGLFRLGGVDFNPADHFHYPFNHALTPYDSGERPKEWTPKGG